VNFASIEPQGQEALLLAFDDGHCDSYSWPLLHALGQAHEKNWDVYLQRLMDAKLTRCDGRDAGPNATLNITVFYFIQLVEISGRDEVGKPDLKLDEAPGLNCAWYADILLTLIEC
jgi:hypothetical protein